MKAKKSLLAILSLVLFFNINNLMAQELNNEKDSVSYILGINLGEQVKQMPYEIDVDQFINGFKTAYAGSDYGITKEEMEAVLNNWQKSMQEKLVAEQNKALEDNKALGAKFLAENAKKKGVKQTESGLQYKVEKMGKGEKPQATDKVKVHYVGTLINGEKFDSSIDRGEPISFPLSGVIKGWTEGLQLMPVGSKFIFYIPSDLAYGDRSMASIPGGSTLIFEVELLDIEKGE